MNAKTPHRRLRVIEYVGEKDWVDSCLTGRSIKGRVDFGDDKGYIQEALLGDTDEILEYSALENAAERILQKAVCPDCQSGKRYDPRDCRTCGGSGWLDGSGPYEETARELAKTSTMLLLCRTDDMKLDSTVVEELGELNTTKGD